MNISEDKKRLRPEAESSRYRLAQSVQNAGHAISENFLRADLLRSNAIVAGYVPMRGEADPSPLMTRLREAGSSLALTRVVGKDQPLQVHLWRGDDAPVKGAFGIMEAASDWPSATPDILLVPLLGFDARGFRLGYGGGFYDRTLQSLRMRATVLAVGVAYAGQEMILPHGENDERLDWIVTEKYARKFEGN
jgi:5-formyltetrahydrofolate cyclo-ligase